MGTNKLVAVAGSTGVAGGQAIERACTILKELARHGRQGARLLDLTTTTGLSRPTVHRMLQSLLQEGFATQHPSKRYGLGPALFELGLLAPTPIDELERFRPLIQGLADQCGDTAHLMVRHGGEVVYLLRAEGAFPIRTYTISVGERLPLVASIGGIAMLACESEEAVAPFIENLNPSDETLRNATAAQVRNEIAFTRKHGYAWGADVVMDGVAGLGAVVPNAEGPIYLAVSIAAIKTRLSGDRIDQVKAMVFACCNQISALINASTIMRRAAR
jgi:DNA-binding IclR family transcriptional regulator